MTYNVLYITYEGFLRFRLNCLT